MRFIYFADYLTMNLLLSQGSLSHRFKNSNFLANLIGLNTISNHFNTEAVDEEIDVNDRLNVSEND